MSFHKNAVEKYLESKFSFSIENPCSTKKIGYIYFCESSNMKGISGAYFCEFR